MKKEIKTWKNLESAFAGESMAYQKYLYFAKLARRKGAEDVAKLFEDTAKHETAHAEGHLSFLYPVNELSVEDLLKIAIEGETHEYTEIYPGFEKTAKIEGHKYAEKEFNEQIEESKEHARNFTSKLDKISKVFGGLAKVEKEHSAGYENALKVLEEEYQNVKTK
jgi:rubrerythrin